MKQSDSNSDSKKPIETNILWFLAEILRVVSKPDCNKILQELLKGELSYSELKNRTRISQGKFSNGIKQLSDKRLIEKRVDLRRNTYYKITNMAERIGVRNMLKGIQIPKCIPPNGDGSGDRAHEEVIIETIRQILPIGSN